MKHFIRIAFIFGMAATVLSATARKEPGTEEVFLFGVGTSFSDTVMYMSAPQKLSTATINKKTGFLEERAYYAFQFKNYLEANYPGYATCAVFYATKRTAIEKKYVKLRRKYAKSKDVRVQEVPAMDFSFSTIQTTQPAESVPSVDTVTVQ